MPTCKLGLYALHAAHPLTTPENMSEMNPIIKGSNGVSNLASSYFFTSPVCLGEEVFDGTYHFGFSHNLFYFFLSQVKVKDDSKGSRHSDMFRACTHVHVMQYA